jgi:hypothetical protein
MNAFCEKCGGRWLSRCPGETWGPCPWCEIRRQKEIIAKLQDALEELCAWQNGPPLISWTDGWTAAMTKAAEALRLTSPRSGGAEVTR